MVPLDDVKHSDLDLFDGEGTEGDDVSTDSSDTTEDNKSEADRDNLLGEDAPASERKKAELIENWAKKIKNGDKTIDDLASKQSWLVADVKKALQSKESSKGDEDRLRQMAKEEAKKIIEEQQAAQKDIDKEREFENEYDNLKKQTLTIDQKRQIQAEFKELVADGVSKVKALRIAAKTAGVDYDNTAEQRRNVGSMRTGDSIREKQDIDWGNQDINAISREDRAEWMRKQAQR